MLEVLASANGHGLDRAELAERSGYSETSSSFTNAVGKLRTLELATKGWPVHASAELFS